MDSECGGYKAGRVSDGVVYGYGMEYRSGAADWSHRASFHFLSREFGAVSASALLPLLQEHYRLAYIRKPEFMGHTRTEEKDPKYKIVTDLPWSEGEIRKRLSLYQALEDRAEVWGRRMPETKRTAYFHLVQYPVQGASQMNKKCLYAQLARHGKADWQLSEQAFDSIVSLTHRYNQGKWQGFMDYKPRNLSVYQRIPKSIATDSLKSTRSYLLNGMVWRLWKVICCRARDWATKVWQLVSQRFFGDVSL